MTEAAPAFDSSGPLVGLRPIFCWILVWIPLKPSWAPVEAFQKVHLLLCSTLYWELKWIGIVSCLILILTCSRASYPKIDVFIVQIVYLYGSNGLENQSSRPRSIWQIHRGIIRAWKTLQLHPSIVLVLWISSKNTHKIYIFCCVKPRWKLQHRDILIGLLTKLLPSVVKYCY